MAGCTALLASSATCMRPTRMWAMRDVNPAWIRTTCEKTFRAELERCHLRWFWENKISTLAVQLVWVIFPDVEIVCVKIFPSSGIHGPQMLSETWKFDYCQLNHLYHPYQQLTPFLEFVRIQNHINSQDLMITCSMKTKANRKWCTMYPRGHEWILAWWMQQFSSLASFQLAGHSWCSQNHWAASAFTMELNTKIPDQFIPI